MKTILGFNQMSVRGIDKVKRELGFVQMVLNVRKIVAQRATLFDKNKENDNFYIISIEIIVFCLVRDIYVPNLFSHFNFTNVVTLLYIGLL